MPLYFVRGQSKWTQEDSKPSLNVGTPISQKHNLEQRREGTVVCTARAMRLKMSEEELAEVIKKNAQNVEMDPEELKKMALQYIKWEESNSNGIEKE